MRLQTHEASPTYELLGKQKAPEIRFLKAAIMKQEEYVEQSPKEVGWMGYAEKINNLLYIVKDVFLLPQEVTGVKTDIDPEIWFKLDDELSEKKLKTVRFWGHSHVKMGVSASGTDAATMGTLSLGTDWFIRAIANKMGEMSVSLFDYANDIAFHDCPWSLPEDKQRAELKSTIAEELEELVRDKPVVIVKKSGWEGSTGWHGRSIPSVNNSPVRKFYDVDKGELVEIKSDGHLKHLLERANKKSGKDSPEGLILDWFGEPGNLLQGT